MECAAFWGFPSEFKRQRRLGRLLQRSRTHQSGLALSYISDVCVCVSLVMRALVGIPRVKPRVHGYAKLLKHGVSRLAFHARGTEYSGSTCQGKHHGVERRGRACRSRAARRHIDTAACNHPPTPPCPMDICLLLVPGPPYGGLKSRAASANQNTKQGETPPT